MEMILVNEIDKNYNKTFEDIKHIDENGIEFWYARDLCLFYNILIGKTLKK